ncbi:MULTISPECIES: pyruvate dehydrogenase [Actinopolyspora]|uniref:Pyruvate dehydrogenase (Quinone) n=1 Tax=Actinopolyspora saharensis TaxID=995062 RepID=A0A1H1H7J3_9ACTN|nr:MULTISPECIES: pyruvate dehydrogenase [Actinopolyspora]NHD18079.1 pyruvate dehydrogenase [Actinopolyspora sp. BKK2]NHE78598.1 pyruvate dehydrogenase [Actinopolyspora sp. BKK1]SDR21321.1 pyruvate dehydrogenase (quinone) [Actinopolyspora saharensis]
MPTVADQFIEVLVEAGVERIYGIVGDSLNPIVDAVRRTPGIEWVYVRHEEAGAFAAAAEAQITGRLAVCAGSSGPGNLHLINGLFDAHRSGAPVLALASQIPSEQIGTAFFQETHPERMFNECSHLCEVLSHPEQMPRLLRSALQTAVGRRGVSVLVMPGDIAERTTVNPTGRGKVHSDPPTVVPPDSQVRALAESLNSAERVMLFCGAGTRQAHDEVMQLADTLKAPVGHALRGKEWIQYDNPFDVGMSGLLGYGACHEAMHKADLVVLLGTDFPYDNFLPQANTVQVDIEPSHLGRRTALDFAVQGDVAETIRAVLPHLTTRTDRDFLDRMLREHADTLERVVEAYTRDVDKQVPIHPEYVADVLDDVADEDAVFTVDTGMCNVWSARYVTPNGSRRVIGSFIHGSMANALPHGIGAQFADPDRQVVAMAGDGGLSMLLGELLTLRTQNLPVKVVLFNNASLGMVKMEMLVDGKPDHGTDHEPVDFAALAGAMGLYAVRVQRPEEVRVGLHDALSHPGPAVIDVVTDPNALSLPPQITGAQVKGFALAVSRTVLSGGVGKMVRLARSNLRNIPGR